MTKSLENVAYTVGDKFLEQGVIGASMIMYFLISAILLWVILSDKGYQKNLSKTLDKMVENQTNFNLLYKESETHNREVIALITKTTELERQNTRECYEEVKKQLLLLVSKGQDHV